MTRTVGRKAIKDKKKRAIHEKDQGKISAITIIMDITMIAIIR